MKKNPSLSVRLSSSTSLKSLASKAKRAEAIASALKRARAASKGGSGVEKRARAAAKGGRKTRAAETQIEVAMRQVRQAIGAVFEGMRVSYAKPERFSHAHSVINLFSVSDFERYKEQLEAWAAEGRDKSRRPEEPRPEVTYAFFPSALDSTRLGSIAIYGNDAALRCQSIRRRGRIFGLPVALARVEMGLRQYVNVTLAS